MIKSPAQGEILNVGYTRVSTVAQDDEVDDRAYGRLVQRRAISAWADMQDPPLTIDMWEHDTCTGTVIDRPYLNKIRALAAHRPVRLIFARQDRLARDAHVADSLYKEFEATGGELVNVTMRFERSMVGKILRRILDNFAELDRHQIVERCTKGKLEAVLKNGTHMFGFLPYGYRQVPKDECDKLGVPHGTLEIIEDEAEIVRLLMQIREMGYSFNAIADWLYTKGFRPKKGPRFAPGTLRGIVHNEDFYRAERVGVSAQGLGLTDEEYAAIRPAHPPILPPREPGQLLLKDRALPKMIQGTMIPDDPFTEEPVRVARRGRTHTLTRSYAQAVIMIRDLRAAGETYMSIAREIRKAGLRTLRGKDFSHCTARMVDVRMSFLEPLAVEALARKQPEAPVIKAESWDGPLALAHQLARKGLGRKRGDMSLGKIAVALNEKYGHTPNGGRFFPETVSRLLAENPPPVDGQRTVAYVRMTRQGEDHMGQVDAIEYWAALNGLSIDHWYIDRAPAYKRADNPELLRLVADCEDGAVHRVVVAAKERFCRDKVVADDITRQISAKAELFFVIGDRAASKNGRIINPPYFPDQLSA